METVGDFSGGPEVKNLPCTAGDMGSIPGRGTNIPQVVEQPRPMLQLLSPNDLEPVSMCHKRSCVPQPRPSTAK